MGLNLKLVAPAAVGLAGVAALVYGIARISMPAAFIVLGVVLIAVAVVPDWGA